MDDELIEYDKNTHSRYNTKPMFTTHMSHTYANCTI